jgi:hypothetical protein
LIIDLSPLNKFIICKSFKMETTRLLISMLRQGQYVIRIDLKDAYFHIPIASAFKRYLRFAYQDRVYEFRALPFGLNVAPRIFTKVFRQIAAIFRDKGWHCHHYIDDWLFFADTSTQLEFRLPQILDTFFRLGVQVNFKKSELTPTQVFQHLGVQFNLIWGIMAPSVQVHRDIGCQVHLLGSPRVTLRQVMSLTGLLCAVMHQVQWGRAHIHPLVYFLNQTFFLRGLSPKHLDRQVQLPATLLPHLRWWLRPDIWQEIPIMPPLVQAHFYTDASLQG